MTLLAFCGDEYSKGRSTGTYVVLQRNHNRLDVLLSDIARPEVRAQRGPAVLLLPLRAGSGVGVGLVVHFCFVRAVGGLGCQLGAYHDTSFPNINIIPCSGGV